MEEDLGFKCPECGARGCVPDKKREEDKIAIVSVKSGMFVDTYYLKCLCCDHHWTERC
jgi:hypothetical protein